MDWTVEVGDETGIHHVIERGPDFPIIANLGAKAQHRIREIGTPAVNVSDVRPDLIIPKVVPDNKEVGRQAARHFLDLGWRKFVYLAKNTFHFEKERYRGFSEQLNDAGYDCAHFVVSDRPRNPGWQPFLNHIVAARRELACFAGTDYSARRLIQSAESQGISVPGDLAVLGVDDDEIYCAIQKPTLSSVATNGRQVGLEAARLMENILAGEHVPENYVLKVPPAGVIERNSTSTRQVQDSLLSKTLALIQQRPSHGWTITSLGKAVGIDPSYLQRKYRAHFNESLKDEILRAQLSEAKRLLRDTDLKIVDVAFATGFKHAGRFSRVFRDHEGISADTYRTRSRVR